MRRVHSLPVALLHYSASRSHLFSHCRLDRVCSPRRPVALPLALPPGLHAAAALHCPTLRCDALRAEPLRSACERCASWRRVEAANVERVRAAFAAQQLAVAVAHAAPAPHHTSAPCELRLPIRADAIRSNRIESNRVGWDKMSLAGIESSVLLPPACCMMHHHACIIMYVASSCMLHHHVC